MRRLPLLVLASMLVLPACVPRRTAAPDCLGPTVAGPAGQVVPGFGGGLYLPAALPAGTGKVVVIDPDPATTWTFIPCRNVWQQRDPHLAPLPLVAALVADPTGPRALAITQSSSQFPVQVWAYDVAADRWSVRPPSTPSPPLLSTVDVAVDARRSLVLLRDAGDGKLWAYEPATNRWSELAQGTLRPPLRDLGPAGPTVTWLAADPTADGLVLVCLDVRTGGRTWRFDLGTGRWSRSADPPAALETGLPLGHLESGGEVVTDTTRRQVLVLTGRTLAGYDPASGRWWTAPAGSVPTDRVHQTLVDDPMHRQVLVFGGIDLGGDGPARPGDVWSYAPDSGRWLRVAPDVSGFQAGGGADGVSSR